MQPNSTDTPLFFYTTQGLKFSTPTKNLKNELKHDFIIRFAQPKKINKTWKNKRKKNQKKRKRNSIWQLRASGRDLVLRQRNRGCWLRFRVRVFFFNGCWIWIEVWWEFGGAVRRLQSLGEVEFRQRVWWQFECRKEIATGGAAVGETG